MMFSSTKNLGGYLLPAASLVLSRHMPSFILPNHDRSSRLQPRLSAFRPSDYVHIYYAVQAYQDNEAELRKGLKQGWKVSATHQAKNGYFGVALQNEDKKHIIVAHRGTDDSNDVTTDADTITRHLNVQEPSAWDDFAKKVIKQHGPEYNYSFTGHSLGGWLAQVCLWKYQDEFVRNRELGYKEAFAVTLDEPGAKDVLEALQPRGSDYRIDVANLDITNYLSCPNGINTIMGHVGTVYALDPELKLTWMQSKTLQFTLAAHKSETLLGRFSPESGTPIQCVRVIDWPRVLWGDKLPSSNQSKGKLGFASYFIHAYFSGKINRGEYTGFYTYGQGEVKNQELLSSDRQFHLQHGIHYRVAEYNPLVLPLRNMPRVARRFLEDLATMEGRGHVIGRLVSKPIDANILGLLDSYEINDDNDELVIVNQEFVASALEFRSKLIAFLCANEGLYKHKLSELQAMLVLKALEEKKPEEFVDVFTQLQIQTISTRRLLDNLIYKQGTATLHKFIKPTLDEMLQISEELQAISVQLDIMEITKLKLADVYLQPNARYQLIEKLQAQEVQLQIAKQATTSLLLYMQNKFPEANRAIDRLIEILGRNNIADLDVNLLKNRAYNLKAKIAAIEGDRALSAEYYKNAGSFLHGDAITMNNLAGLLTDTARAENKPKLFIEAYRYYQEVYPCLAQFKPEQAVIARSGMAYGLIMLAQAIDQGIIDPKEAKLPTAQDLRLQAKHLLKSAIENNPNYLNARLFAALLAYTEKNYELALQEINNALTLQPQHPTALMRKGLILEEMVQINEALDYLALAKERLEAIQEGNENASWIKEIDEAMARMQQERNKSRPSAKL